MPMSVTNVVGDSLLSESWGVFSFTIIPPSGRFISIVVTTRSNLGV